MQTWIDASDAQRQRMDSMTDPEAIAFGVAAAIECYREARRLQDFVLLRRARWIQDQPVGDDSVPADVNVSIDRLAEELEPIFVRIAGEAQEWRHPIQRAEVINMAIRHLDSWSATLRQARNQHIRDSLAELSPGRVARRLCLSKTYVLRLRGCAA